MSFPAPLSDKTDAPTPGQTHTPAKDRLSLGQLLGFATGGLPYNLGLDGLKQLANPIYNIVLGVNPALIGTVLMAARLWDACTDPVMGVISDNTRSRWGRRRPFIAIGALLCGLTFPLVWLVPSGVSHTFAITYFAVTSVLFYTAFTVFSVPYVTLAMELTPDYAERTRVVAARTYFASLSNLILAWAFRATQWEGFGDAANGVRYVGAGIGVLFFVAGVVPAFCTRERYLELARHQPRQKLIPSFKIAMSNQPFRVLIVLTLLLVLGTYTFNTLGIYVTTYHIFHGDVKAAATVTGLAGTVHLFVNWAMLPLITIYARKHGKIRALQVCLSCGVLAGAFKWFLFTPTWPYAQLALPLLMAPAGAGFFLMVNSMKADVCDWDELQSGVRREGAYAAISSWFQRFSSALTLSLTGFLLVGIGFDQAKGGGQSPDTIFWLRIAFSVAPAAAFLACLWALRRYPLTAQRMSEIRGQLEARRSTI